MVSRKPAKLSGDFGARSGGTGNLASANGTSPTIVANGIGNVTRAPDVSFGRSVPLSVARSLSSGHLNLSQPTGSAPNAGAAIAQAARTMNAVLTAQSRSSATPVCNLPACWQPANDATTTSAQGEKRPCVRSYLKN